MAILERMLDIDDICKKCKWWYKKYYYAGEKGECRSNSPYYTDISDDGNKRVFPITSEDDYCGQFIEEKYWEYRGYNGSKE